MSAEHSANLMEHAFPFDVNAPPAVSLPNACPQQFHGWHDQLRHSYNCDFTIIDLCEDRVLHPASDQPIFDWYGYAELCHAVIGKGQPEFVASSGPAVILAIPMPEPGNASIVALGIFLTQPAIEQADVEAFAEELGLERESLESWCQNQPTWPDQALLRMGEAVLEKCRSDQRSARLQDELTQVTTNLSNTYEEISLLHRLTQNLKASSSDALLCQLALEWLSDALPAEGLMLKLAPLEDARIEEDSPTEEVIFTRGETVLEHREIDAFVDCIGRQALREPIVVNRTLTSKESWPFPQVREVISTPLSEGGNVFGWIIALNHCEGREFGTVEASLLSSVGTILGIHRSNNALYREQEEFLTSVVRALTSAIDAKDPYTCGHSDRVARVAVRLGRELGCDTEELNTIYLSGLLHDIGKIGIDDHVLRKAGALTKAEFEHIKLHPGLGHMILRDLKQLDQVLPVVLHHHESWDGSGYPNGLAAEEIPFLARIVAVADSFDAMSSDRPYRKGMEYEKLDEIFRGGSGRQWDPRVIDAYFAAREDILGIVERDREDLVLDVNQWT